MNSKEKDALLKTLYSSWEVMQATTTVNADLRFDFVRDLVNKLATASTIANTLAENECSSEWHCNTVEGQRAVKRSTTRLTNLVETVESYLNGVHIEIGGDPRGYCLKLQNMHKINSDGTKGDIIYNSFGGRDDGYGI